VNVLSGEASSESNDSQGLAGQFLIGLPSLGGDYFKHSLSLLIEHDEAGAFALMLNRPLDLTLQDLFDMPAPAHTHVPVLEGGPVQPESAFFLHRGNEHYEASLAIPLASGERIQLTTSDDLLEDLSTGDGPTALLAVVGYAGWGPGQLEAELSENIWLITPADSHIIFETPYEKRASAAAGAMGIDINLMSSHPGHG